jgi:hypothetical protein
MFIKHSKIQVIGALKDEEHNIDDDETRDILEKAAKELEANKDKQTTKEEAN